MPYLMNCWYTAAFSEEISQAPICRTLLGQPLALFRTEEGSAVALHDRCPHRFAPLHKGKVIGEAIQCPYHGLRFDAKGACVFNPSGDGKLPRAAQVVSYPLRELDGIIWIWFGDETPDESQIVRYEIFNQPDRWTTIQDRLDVAASYALVADNLLDLSHAEFVHPDLATPGFNKRVQLTVEQEGDEVIANNWRPSEPITPGFRRQWGPDAPELVDHRSVVRWNPPATLWLDIGVTRVGAPESEAIKSIAAHLVTPETENTCHYFWKSARNHHIGDEAFSHASYAVIDKAFRMEDKPMIEAQQRLMEGRRFEELNPIPLGTDIAAMRARRVLNAKLAAQASA